jgi:hypothetical protein
MRLLLAAAATAAALPLASLAAPAAADAAVVVDPVPGTDVDQLAGWLAYPRPAGEGLRELVLRAEDGSVTRVAGAQEADFQQDLGTDADGRVVLVYVRCEEDCTLRLRDVETSEERGLPSSGRDRVPAIWDGVLAFSRAYAPRREGGPPREFVYLRRLGADRPPRRVWGPSGRANSNVTSLDYGSGGLAFGRDWGEPGAMQTELWVKRPGRPTGLVARIGSGELSRARHRGPSVAGTTLYWAYHRAYDAPAGLLLRRDLATGRTEEARVPGLAWSVGADALRPDAPIALGSINEFEEGDDTNAVWLLRDPAPSFERARRGIGIRG